MKNFSLKTKGNYPLSSKERGKKRYIVLVLGIAFVVLFGIREIAGNMGMFLTTPFLFVRHYIETSSATIPVFIRSRNELSNRIEELEQELVSREGSEIALRYLEKENQELRDLLLVSSSTKILAGVIARPPLSPYDTIVIDQGSIDGIVPFAPVYHGKGMAIGYVRTVYPRTALISLFSSPGVESTVYVFGPNLFTTAYGEGGGVIRLSVPQGVPVEKGDIAILPSLDAGILGSIEEVQSIPTEPEQRAYIMFSTPLQSMRLVSVGTTPLEAKTFDDIVEEVESEAKKRITFPIPAHSQIHFGSTSSSSLPESVPSSTQNASGTHSSTSPL